MFPKAVPDYVNKYPQIAPTIPRLHNMLKQLQIGPDRLQSEGHFEVEARFGTINNDGKNSFQSGVPLEFFQQCLKQVESFDEWKKVTDKEQTHDYYYELPPHPEDLRGQGILVRTTTEFRTLKEPTENGCMSQMVTTHMCKQGRDKQDFRYLPNVITGFQSSHPGLDVRVSLNFEEKVPVDSIPSRTQPKFVRIKDRKSFIYQPDHAKTPIWSIDFTESWNGNTRTEAEMKQKSGQTVYEIEVECLDPFTYMTDSKRDVYYLATSLMLKMRDFVGVDKAFHWDPLFRYSAF